MKSIVLEEAKLLGFYSDSFKVAIVIPSNKTGDKTNVMQKV